MPKTPATATPSAPTDAAPTYEAALMELEGLVSRMESGQVPLDDLLSDYKRGAALLSVCRDKLVAVEQQIKLLDGKSLQE